MDDEIAASSSAVAGALAAAGERIPCLDEQELIEVLVRVESVYRQCYAVALGAMAGLERARFATVEGCPSTAALLEHRLHLSRGEARARAGDAARGRPGCCGGEHHRLIHFTVGGPHDPRTPEFISPEWLDADRTARTNSLRR